MKTRKTFIAAAIVAVLSCSAAHAQVLGGGVGGAVNGALGGGLRDTSVFGNGNAAGSFGGELDTGSTMQRTRGAVDHTRGALDHTRSAADQTTGRARNLGTNVRNRTESTVATAHDTSANAATSAVTAAHAAKDESQSSPKGLDLPKVDSVATDANSAAAGNASASRRNVAADVAADGSAAASANPKQEDTQK